jgi:acyl dehydratase
LGLDVTDLSEVKTLHVTHPDHVDELVGGTFVSAWFQVDAERADMFHRGTYMDLYAHPSPEEAYGDGLVEGFHLLGMLDYLLNTVLWAEGNTIAWNYGLDKVRFVTVIRDSDRFRVRGTVREVVDRADQGKLLVVDVTGEVAGRTQPGFVATLRLLWREVPSTDHPAVSAVTGEATPR